MIIDVEDNPNCTGCGVMRFQEQSLPRRVSLLTYRDVDGAEQRCRVTGYGPDGISPARARKVADSGDGSVWMVYGGQWGLRLAPHDNKSAWQLDHPEQWGEPFITLDSVRDLGNE